MENLSSLNTNNNDYFKVKAPELIKNSQYYTFKTDIWYLGLLIYEITQLKPIDKDYLGNKDNIYNYIIRANYSLNNYYSNDIKELIKLCLRYTPNKRPSAQDLLKIIEIYKKNQVLYNKINIYKNTKNSHNIKRKINLKDEIDKINRTLAKIKNYDNNKITKYKIHRDLTPELTRKNSNYNLNINAKNILFKNSEFTNNNTNKKYKKPKLKLKTSFIDNYHKINFGFKTGKKFFGIHKNNETLQGYLKTKPFDIKNFVIRNPTYFQYERNKTPNRFYKINQNSLILMNNHDENNLCKEANYKKINAYKTFNCNKNDFKRARSFNYYKINKKVVNRNKKIFYDKFKRRNNTPFKCLY